MDVEVKMPDLSTTGDEVIMLEWLVELGQSVKRGQALFQVETDKATMEVESIASGVLKSQHAGPNDTIAIGSVVAVLEVERSAPTSKPSSSSQSPKQPPVESTMDPPPTQFSESDAAPFAVATRAPRGSGMFAKNREAAQAHVEAAGQIPVSKAQKTVGRRMQQSKQSIPHFYLQTSANAEPMLCRRSSSGVEGIAWDSFFVCAVAKSLKKFPKLTHRIRGEHMVLSPTDAIGVAVDVHGELYVITITGAASMTLEEVSAAIRNNVSQLSSGSEEFKRLQAADITITNLGMENVETFLPIINPPESAIIGIGKIAPQAAVVDDELAIQHRLSLTLSVDHRIVNGKYAADFLGNFVDELESY